MEHFQVLCLQKMDKFQEDNSDEIRQTINIPSFRLCQDGGSPEEENAKAVQI